MLCCNEMLFHLLLNRTATLINCQNSPQLLSKLIHCWFIFFVTSFDVCCNWTLTLYEVWRNLWTEKLLFWLISFRSKRLRLVSEQRKTEKQQGTGSLVLAARKMEREPKTHISPHFSCGLLLSLLVLRSKTTRKRLLRRLLVDQWQNIVQCGVVEYDQVSLRRRLAFF